MQIKSKPGTARRFTGFTLIELVVALAIIGIVLSIGIPGMSHMILDTRRSAALNDMVGTLSYARVEAIILHRPVSVCRVAPGTESDPHCAESKEGGWENGWLVFIDNDHDGLRRPDERLLRQHESLSAGTTLRGNSRLVDSIGFSAYGTTADNGRLIYCDQRGWSEDVRIVVVATTGRVRMTTTASDNNTPLKGCTG